MNRKKLLFPDPPASLAASPEFVQAWGWWLDDRRARRKPVTAYAATLQLRQLEKWGPAKAVRAIERAVERGWQGLFDPDEGYARPAPPARRPVIAVPAQGPWLNPAGW